MARPNGGCNPCLPVNSATVYPDGVPPPPQIRPEHSGEICCNGEIATFFVCILVFAPFAGLFCFAYSYETNVSNPAAPEFQFDSAIFTSLDNATDPNLTAKLNITFMVTNPNKNYSISYNTIVVTLDYGGGCDCEQSRSSSLNFCNVLASIHFPTFLQLNNTNNTLPFQLNVADQIVGDTIVADRARGSIKFGLKLIARFSLKDHYYDYNTVEFYCKRLSFVFNSNNATFVSGRCLYDSSDTLYESQ